MVNIQKLWESEADENYKKNYFFVNPRKKSL